jgi:hypothetical protein
MMRKLVKIASRFVLIGLLPISAYADITVINTTNVDATAYSPYYEQCSSSLGSRGIIKANKMMSIKQAYVDTFCSKQPCDAEIHMSNDCRGKTIGTIQIDATKGGITAVNNLDVDGYRLRKIDKSTTIIEKNETINGLFGALFNLKQE